MVRASTCIFPNSAESSTIGRLPLRKQEVIIDTARLKKHCASLAGVTATLYDAPSNILVYSVGDKKFAYFKTSEPEKWRFSLRVSPDRFLELTGMPGIKPARYMGRFHWVTIVNPHSLPAKYLVELIDWSYHKALGSLSRQRRDEVMGMPEHIAPVHDVLL